MTPTLSCPECGKTIRAPQKITSGRGRCPACHAAIDLRRLTGGGKPAETVPRTRNTTRQAPKTNPLILITERYASNLKRYGVDLQKVYALIRERLIHREEYDRQKNLLRKEAFSAIIRDLAALEEFSFSLRERIELWYMVFALLPYTDENAGDNIVFNLYPRFEYACLVGTGYVLSGYPDRKLKRTIITKAVRGERTTPRMKELFHEIKRSLYGEAFIAKTRAFLGETREISGSAPPGEDRAARQITEDFNFGFSWIAFHLPFD